MPSQEAGGKFMSLHALWKAAGSPRREDPQTWLATPNAQGKIGYLEGTRETVLIEDSDGFISAIPELAEAYIDFLDIDRNALAKPETQ